jgi:starvation-inducible DNA-binding protein
MSYANCGLPWPVCQIGLKSKQAGTEGPGSRSVRYWPRFAKAREAPSSHHIINPQIRKVTAVNKVRALDTRRKAALDTPTDLSEDPVKQISAKLGEILATTFALYIKTKNFHWHVSGPHFRDYHLLLDEQGEQIFASTDDIAERARKIGGTTIRSIGQIAKLQGIEDNDESYVAPGHMLRELMADNKAVIKAMRECHELCDQHEDVATASLLENFIDQAERRTWFLFEASRKADASGH